MVYLSADRGMIGLERYSLGEYQMKISARNVLKGRIKQIVRGAVNSEVVIELPGGIEVTSIITNTSVDNLGLKEGSQAYAVIKASSVMIAVD